MSKDAVTGEILDSLEETFDEHRGPDEAITSSELSEQLEIADSEANPKTREAIRVLCDERKIPVAASHAGYYRIQTRQQLEEYQQTLRARIRGIEERLWMAQKAFEAGRTGDQTTLPGGVADD